MQTYDARVPEPEIAPKVSAAAPDTPGRGHVGLPPQMSDVAKVAGVSHQTVSRVLDDFPKFRPATRPADPDYRKGHT